MLITLVARGDGWRFRIRKATLVTAMAALIVGPWLARNAVVMGKPGICTIVGGYTFWGAIIPKWPMTLI